MRPITIAAVEVQLVQPGPWSFCIVRVRTSEPGLEGIGCASFKQRCRAVEAAIVHHLAPFAVGRDALDTEDFWQSAHVNGYWRNGPVLNCALGGIDLALWDIKGKVAGLPCHQLWGGRSRGRVPVYLTAHGRNADEVLRNAQRWLGEGCTHLRCQLGGYDGVPPAAARLATDFRAGVYFDPRERLRSIPELFGHLRRHLPPEVELLYDAHERLAPVDAIWLAKALEPHRPFFLEDPLPPEHLDWLPQFRAQCATPIALGELFSNPAEYRPAIANRWIDFIKVRPIMLGGITPTLKLLHLAEAFGVRFCLHGPGDYSLVGAAANVHLSAALHNFGILEWVVRPEVEYEIFPGAPRAEGGCVTPSDRPGLGISFEEARAAAHPYKPAVTTDTITRLPDGTMWWP